MNTIEIGGRKHIKCEHFNQFRNHVGARRIGMKYWLRIELDEKIYFVQYTIDEKTTASWLKNMIKDGLIWLDAFDHGMSFPNAMKLNVKEMKIEKEATA